MRSGALRGSSAGPSRPAPRWLLSWPRSWPRGPTPSRVFAVVSPIMRLGRRYGDARLEAAAARALAIRALSYRSVESILKGGLDRLPLPGSEPVTTTIGDHANVRGAGYYE